MSRARPDRMVRDIYELTPSYFLDRGIRLLALDLDNTLAPYGMREAGQGLLSWAGSFREAGVLLYILSNNRGGRPALFAKALGCGFVGRARKPRTDGLREICRRSGAAPSEIAVVGDQIRTDVRCARRFGSMAVLVRPISLRNPFLAARYALEAPWRAAYRRSLRPQKRSGDTT